MRSIVLTLLALVLVTGCARSTVEKRKKERFGAYTSLSDEFRSLVDREQIAVGMPADAVYIAWGKPDQVVSSQTPSETTVTWLYHGTTLESYRYWTHRGVHYKNHVRSEPYLAHDYYVRSYIGAEVVFVDGKVAEWRTFPYPVY